MKIVSLMFLGFCCLILEAPLVLRKGVKLR